jgi:hypothetical protein
MLGELANTSPYTVARFVDRAVQAGWIDWRYGRVRILELGQLTAFAAGQKQDNNVVEVSGVLLITCELIDGTLKSGSIVPREVRNTLRIGMAKIAYRAASQTARTPSGRSVIDCHPAASELGGWTSWLPPLHPTRVQSTAPAIRHRSRSGLSG